MSLADDMRAAALKATPGPWYYQYDKWPDRGDNSHNIYAKPYEEVVGHRAGADNSAYIAACSPERILALLDVLEAAQICVDYDDSAGLEVALARWKELG